MSRIKPFGTTFLRKPKNVVRKIAQNKMGLDRESQDKEILYSARMSKAPLGVGLKCELMLILLKNLEPAK